MLTVVHGTESANENEASNAPFDRIVYSGAIHGGIVKQLTDMETEEGRREAVLEAMGSFALEGMQPTADTVAWARDYIAGRLTTAQILQRLKRKYGVD